MTPRKSAVPYATLETLFLDAGNTLICMDYTWIAAELEKLGIDVSPAEIQRAEAAARHYFGVSAAQLDAGQAARLAAMLPRPQYYDRNRGSRYLAAYSGRIHARMNAAVVP